MASLGIGAGAAAGGTATATTATAATTAATTTAAAAGSTTAANIAAGVSAGLTVLQIKQGIDAAKIAAGDRKLRTSQAELGALQREADRKKRLALALASQNAQAGAKGVAAFEGSPLAILAADIETEETATERDAFNTKVIGLALKSRSKVARKQAKAAGTLTLISDTQKALE